MTKRTHAERLAVLERESIDNKAKVDKVETRLGAIERNDAVQNRDIHEIKSTVQNMDGKLDKVVEFVTEANGGKKWMLTGLSVVGSVLAIFAYFQFKGD